MYLAMCIICYIEILSFSTNKKSVNKIYNLICLISQPKIITLSSLRNYNELDETFIKLDGIKDGLCYQPNSYKL